MSGEPYFLGSSGEPLAEQRVADDGGTAWIWLLRDPAGSVATEMRNDGVVTAQKAYSPYGTPDKGGTSFTSVGGPLAGRDGGSALGYRAAKTDPATGKLLLGPRQYDPDMSRFTSTDFYPSGGADLQLALDPLTGNRFLFAGANPVAFFDDGHRPCEGAYSCDGDGGPSGPGKSTATASERRAGGTSEPTYWEAVRRGVITSGDWDIAAALHQAATEYARHLPSRATVVGNAPRVLARGLALFSWYSRTSWRAVGNGIFTGASIVASYNQYRGEGDSVDEAVGKTVGGTVGGTLGSGLAAFLACTGSGGLLCPAAVGFAGFFGSRAGEEFGAEAFGGPHDYPRSTYDYTSNFGDTQCRPGVYSVGC